MFTYKTGYIYPYCRHPDSNEFNISSLKIKGEFDIVTGTVEVLGDLAIANTERSTEGLRITLDKSPVSDKPVCFKIEIV